MMQPVERDTLYDKWYRWSGDLKPNSSEYTVLGLSFAPMLPYRRVEFSKEDNKYPSLKKYDKRETPGYYVYIPRSVSGISASMLYREGDSREMRLIREHYWSNHFKPDYLEKEIFLAMEFPKVYAEFHKQDPLEQAALYVKRSVEWQAKALKVGDIVFSKISNTVTFFQNVNFKDLLTK
jgi:hypothetical protein